MIRLDRPLPKCVLMQPVLSTLPTQPAQHSPSPIPFFHMLERLKTTKREGWRRFGIGNGESISDHMYRMSIMTMLAPPSLAKELDIQRCTQMALIHDMAESLVGDITPRDGVAKAEKSRRESETMDYLCDNLLGKVNGGLTGEKIKEIWWEYEDGKTKESKYVHDVDKVELLLQMVEYEKSATHQLDLGEFSWVAERVLLEECKAWSRDILAERAAFWESKGVTPKGAEISEKAKEQNEEYYAGAAK